MTTMKHATLCLLVQEDQVLLAMKKRGFGEGKWNGAGGKVQEGENIRDAAIRETREELGVTLRLADLTKAAEITFRFPEHPAWDQVMHVFVLSRWEGEPQESDEMRPQWFPKRALPKAEMWAADCEWMPLVLSGEFLKGVVVFDGDGGAVRESNWEIANSFPM